MGRPEDLFTRIEQERVEAIRELIRNRQSEELFLDFKRSSDNGQNSSLSQNDRNNLAKAISGFGNSAGGIIIWGVDCSKGVDGSDVAKCEIPLEDANRFKSWLEGAVSGCTFPPHGGVRHLAVENNQGSSGFVVTYIPESNHVPHQVVKGTQYYMRAGSDFLPVPHQILAGMFGRRPQPNIVGQLTLSPVKIISNSIRCELGLLLKNEGAGIARDMFMDVKILGSVGPNCTFSFNLIDQDNWNNCNIFGGFSNFVARLGYLLPPGSISLPLVMNIKFEPPFEKELNIEITQGCDGAPLCKIYIKNDPDKIEIAYRQFMEVYKSEDLTDADKQNIISSLLGKTDI